jgi:murein DD-endopeptidase MepM/ murein hydrolase activator NlpD
VGGRALRLAAAFVAALTCAAPAWGHTDGGRQLSFAWPASGEVTRGFGYDDGERHAGVDIGDLRSLTVEAAAEGVVRKVGYTFGFEGYGQIVLVSVGAGYETLYAHLAEVDVRPGERVTSGERLGLAGSTGLSTGVHLHFELRYDGTAIDPAPLLPAGAPAAPPQYVPAS